MEDDAPVIRAALVPLVPGGKLPRASRDGSFPHGNWGRPWMTNGTFWLWLTVCYGFSMALIEIDGWPFLIAWWIFPWQTVKFPDGWPPPFLKRLNWLNEIFHQTITYMIIYDMMKNHVQSTLDVAARCRPCSGPCSVCQIFSQNLLGLGQTQQPPSDSLGSGRPCRHVEHFFQTINIPFFLLY